VHTYVFTRQIPKNPDATTVTSALSRQLASKISNSMLDTDRSPLFTVFSAQDFTREFANILSNYNPN